MFCAACESAYKIRPGQSWTWPDWIRCLYREAKRGRYAERRDLIGLVDQPSIVAQLAYGESYLSSLDANARSAEVMAGEPLELPERSPGGQLRCCRCGCVWSDKQPTFPLPPRRWLLPVCPACGACWYADAAEK
ncbi:MAG: hypothetical protein JXA74_02345 [Anaerolineae bacterium]|nr:hypothetical protein [Anaerolineae bacterium]